MLTVIPARDEEHTVEVANDTGGVEGLLGYLETKTVILDGPPAGYRTQDGAGAR